MRRMSRRGARTPMRAACRHTHPPARRTPFPPSSFQVLVFFTWVVRGAADTVSMWDAVERVATFVTNVPQARVMCCVCMMCVYTCVQIYDVHVYDVYDAADVLYPCRCDDGGWLGGMGGTGGPGGWAWASAPPRPVHSAAQPPNPTPRPCAKPPTAPNHPQQPTAGGGHCSLGAAGCGCGRPRRRAGQWRRRRRLERHGRAQDRRRAGGPSVLGLAHVCCIKPD